MAIGVSGTTVTIGTPANIITTSCVVGSATTYALTATTALVLYKSGAGVPYANNAVVISVAGTTCTVNTPVALTGVVSSLNAPPSSCMLSATKCLVGDDNNTAGSVISSVFTISGTTVTAGTAVSVDAGITTSSSYTADAATRYNPHLFPLSVSTALLWYFDSGGVSRAVVLTESAGVVTKGAILYRSISSATANNAGFGAILPQGASEFMAIREQLANTAGFGLILTSCKISGTNITQGDGKALRNLLQVAPSIHPTVRLSSGDYVVLPYGSSSIPASNILPVFRSNGDAINYRGEISCPSVATNNGSVAAVASNRIVVIGAANDGTAITATTYPLRLLNIEIAA